MLARKSEFNAKKVVICSVIGTGKVSRWVKKLCDREMEITDKP